MRHLLVLLFLLLAAIFTAWGFIESKNEQGQAMPIGFLFLWVLAAFFALIGGIVWLI